MKFNLGGGQYTVEGLTTCKGCNDTIIVGFTLVSRLFGGRYFEYSTVSGTVRADSLDFYGFKQG